MSNYEVSEENPVLHGLVVVQYGHACYWLIKSQVATNLHVNKQLVKGEYVYLQIKCYCTFLWDALNFSRKMCLLRGSHKICNLFR